MLRAALSLQDDHGILHYLDTSVGKVVAEHRTRLGALKALCHNPHNAIVHLGHHNGEWEDNTCMYSQCTLTLHRDGVSVVAQPEDSVGEDALSQGTRG